MVLPTGSGCMLFNREDYARLTRVVLLISAAAWTEMLLEVKSSRCPFCSSTYLVINGSVWIFALSWAIMLVAMMAPTLIPVIYKIRQASFVSRRSRSTAFFLFGYISVWMLVGGILATLASALIRWASYDWTLVFMASIVWQASPIKQKCLNRCHSHRSLPAFGFAADYGAVGLGLEHGAWCVGSCWSTMLLPMLLPDFHVLAMAAVSMLMFCERLDPPQAPSWRLRGLVTAWRLVRLNCARPLHPMVQEAQT